MHSSWRFVEQAAKQHSVRVLKNTGVGKLRKRKFTGAHKFMRRTDRDALIERLGG